MAEAQLATVDVNSVRRKIYEAVLHELIPRLVGWAAALVLLLVLVASFLLLGVSSRFPILASIIHWASPATALAAALDTWRSWKSSEKSKLEEKAHGDLLKLVREPDYEGKMGFLYLVESDVREVLDLVATPETPLVIFVDDLDRCVPHKVAEVVEAISLFLAGDYPTCIFVMGMEPHVVAAALEVANSDLIKRMDSLGFGDDSAPMGWRFMEKIVQLPIMLPPPTKFGMTSYLDALAPTQQDGTDAAPAELAPDEGQVQHYMETLLAQPSLSDVVNQTQELLDKTPESDNTAIAEASKRVYSRKFDERDPLVRKFVESAVQVFGANPRQVKRYINLFRLCCNLRHSIWLDSVASGISVELPSDDQVTKFVTFSVQWPQATSLFRRPDRAEASIGDSVLAVLEELAIKLESDGSDADGKWEALLRTYGLDATPWAMTRHFRCFLANRVSLSGAANNGLW